MRSAKYFSVIGIVLFAYILYSRGPSQILAVLSAINLEYAFFAILITPIAFVLKSIRWKIIINSYGVNYPLSRCFHGFLVGLFFSQLTPGRVGDFVRAFYLKEEGLSTGKSLATVLVDRLFDLVGLAVMAVLGIIFIAGTYANISNFGAVLMAIAVLLSMIAVFFKEGITRKISLPIFRTLLPEKYRPYASDVLNEFYFGANTLVGNKIRVIVLILLTLFGWGITISGAYILAIALNISIPFLFFASIIPIVTLITIIPLSVSGIGTREAAMIFFFGLVGVGANSAVALSLVVLVLISLLFAFLGAFVWMKRPAKLI